MLGTIKMLSFDYTVGFPLSASVPSWLFLNQEHKENQPQARPFPERNRQAQGVIFIGYGSNPRSQSLSQSYGSILPTSLTYILPLSHRLPTLETWCGYRYDGRLIECHSVFQGSTYAIQTVEKSTALPDKYPPRWLTQFHGSYSVKRKRKFLLVLR